MPASTPLFGESAGQTWAGAGRDFSNHHHRPSPPLSFRLCSLANIANHVKESDSSDAKASPSAKPADAPKSSGEMFRFVLELVRPYRNWLIVIFIAMVIETAMSIAAPWPLKIIIDNVVGHHKLPEFLTGCATFPWANTRWRWPASRRSVDRHRGIGAAAGYLTTITLRASRSTSPTIFASGCIIISIGSR
jgi:hypothetical protein